MGSAKMCAEHWKGNWAHSDTARAQIESSNGLTNPGVRLRAYTNGTTLIFDKSAGTYINEALGYGKTVTSTLHNYRITKGSDTHYWRVDGTK